MIRTAETAKEITNFPNFSREKAKTTTALGQRLTTPYSTVGTTTASIDTVVSTLIKKDSAIMFLVS